MFGNNEEVKIQNKMKFKQKLHNKVIKPINFNNFGSSFITNGAYYAVQVYDNEKILTLMLFLALVAYLQKYVLIKQNNYYS